MGNNDRLYDDKITLTLEDKLRFDKKYHGGIADLTDEELSAEKEKLKNKKSIV